MSLLFIKVWAFALLVPTCILFVAVYLADLPAPSLPLPRGYLYQSESNRPRTFSHRGSTKLFPQNTLFAHSGSLVMGADVLDMDVRLTKDGEVVVIHDESTLGVTGIHKKVHETSFEELQAMDFGFTFSSDSNHTKFPYRGIGIRVLTLKEILTRFPQDTLLNIELKIPGPGFVGSGGALPESVCQLLRRHGAARRAIVMSFSDMAWFKFRRVCPEVATAPGPLLMLPTLVLSMLLGRLWDSKHLLPFNAVQPPYGITSGLLVDAVHKVDRAVHVWTVDEPTEMHRMARLNVDGIMSDRLDVLVAQFDGHGGKNVITQAIWDGIPTSEACDTAIWTRYPAFAHAVQDSCLRISDRVTDGKTF